MSWFLLVFLLFAPASFSEEGEAALKREMQELYDRLTDEQKRQHQINLAKKYPLEKFHIASIFLRIDSSQAHAFLPDAEYPFETNYDVGMYWLIQYMRTRCGWTGVDAFAYLVHGERSKKDRILQITSDIFLHDKDAWFIDKKLPKDLFADKPWTKKQIRRAIKLYKDIKSRWVNANPTNLQYCNGGYSKEEFNNYYLSTLREMVNQ